jgi:hypothetical protein
MLKLFIKPYFTKANEETERNRFELLNKIQGSKDRNVIEREVEVKVRS